MAWVDLTEEYKMTREVGYFIIGLHNDSWRLLTRAVCHYRREGGPEFGTPSLLSLTVLIYTSPGKG